MVKTIYLCALFLALISSSLASNVPEDDDQDPNAFVDAILVIGVQKLHEQGVISIAGEHKLGPLGLFKIQDVSLLGIENIQRLGDASIVGDQDAGVLNVNASFTVTNIRANSSFVVQLPLQSEKRVIAMPTISQIDLKLSCEYNPSAATLKLYSVNIISYDGVYTEIEGLGLFNPIIEKLTTVAADVLEKIISKVLNVFIQNSIDGLIIDVPTDF